MKKILLYGLSIIGLSLTLGGCMPEDKNSYVGPTLVEFKNHLQGKVSLPVGVIAAGQTLVSRSVNINTRVTDTIYVQLVGPLSGTAQSIPFSVDATSTAVAGVNYNFRPAGSSVVTIPANSSVGFLLVDMIPNSIVAPAIRPLKITLVGNAAVSASENYKTFTLNLRN